MINLLPAIILPLILGYLVITLLLKRTETSILERLCLSYPAGAGILTMTMFLIGLMKIPYSLFSITISIIIEIGILSFYMWRKGIRLIPEKFSFYKSSNRLEFYLAIILALWLAVKISSILIETYQRPIYAWDSWANWSARAKLFYHSQGLLLDSHDSYLGKAVLSIISYPLHNPLMQVWMAEWIGNFDEVLVKFWSPFYLISIAVYLIIIGKRLIGAPLALLFVAIFVSSPFVSYHAIETYSDLPLGAYLLLAIVSFYNAMHKEMDYLFLTGLFSAEALFTKDEAMFFVIPLLFSITIYLFRHGKLRLLWKAMILLTLALPWFAFKFTHNLHIGAETFSWHLTFQPDAIGYFILNFLSIQNFGFFMVFFIFGVFAVGRRHLYLSSVVAVYILFFLGLYTMTSFYYEQFMSGTVFFRNLLTCYPSIALLNLLFLKTCIEPRKL